MRHAERPDRPEACPLCGGSSRRLFAKHRYWIRGCEVCRHRFAEGIVLDGHVERIYGDSYFLGGGAGYPGYLREERTLRDRGRWYGRLLARYMERGTVLDVGCAAGFWLAGLVESGWRGRGVEPNAAMAEFARTRLGLAVEAGTLEGLEPDEQFDLVALIQVMAHFVDPRRAMEAAATLVRPGGWLLVETWNRNSVTARLFGQHWHEYSPPSVLHWFSPKGLRRLAEPFGFSEVARGRPRKRIRVEHAKSLLSYKLDRSRGGRVLMRALGVVPDGLSVPYPADDLFWILLRKSAPPS